MKFALSVLVALLLVVSSYGQVQVTATASTNGTTVNVKASATSSRPITGWHIYADNRDVYGVLNVSSINANLSLTMGTHTLIVRAWDASGAYASRTLSVTVTDRYPAPVPPPNATVISRVEEMPGWGHCLSAQCSGSNNPATYWMAQFQSTPSLDGASTHYYVNGSPYADILWWKNLPAMDAATHFIMDYSFMINNVTTTTYQALEFDFLQVVNGRKYNFSSQCHRVGGLYPHWDTWHEQDGSADSMRWIHTNIPCPVPTPNVWHRVLLVGERGGTQTHYLSITMDGKTYPMPDSYTWQPAPLTSWQHKLAVQVQLDLNSKGGEMHEWVDKLTLYVW